MGVPVHQAINLAKLPGIAHGFFGREGGVSQGLYASLNCGPGSKDDPALVARNRSLVVETVAPETRLATLSQIHSPNVLVLGPGWDERIRPEGDGLPLHGAHASDPVHVDADEHERQGLYHRGQRELRLLRHRDS